MSLKIISHSYNRYFITANNYIYGIAVAKLLKMNNSEYKNFALKECYASFDEAIREIYFDTEEKAKKALSIIESRVVLDKLIEK